MIRALGAVLATTLGAQADMPSPLFCETLAWCETATACQPLRTGPPFVLRQTDGEWVKHLGPRQSDTWVFMATSRETAHADAPEGVQVALVAAGLTSEGAFLFHEHSLEPEAVGLGYFRHQCETGAAERTS